MKRLTLAAAITTLALGAGVNLAQAANVEVQWQEPEHYRDIRATNESQAHFQERVMADLESTFRKEAAKLPDNQTLHIAVNDVDLAGDIEYFHNNYPFGLRVVRRVDAPSMTLHYELRDANDMVVKAGDETLRDLGFDFNTTSRNTLNPSPLHYENQMIRDWVRDTFTPNAS